MVRPAQTINLVENVRGRRLLGEWQDVVRLGEAALLLDPGSAATRQSVAEAYGYLAVDTTTGTNQNELLAANMQFSRGFSRMQRRQFALTGVNHWRAFFSMEKPNRVNTQTFARFIEQTAMAEFTAPEPGAEWPALHADLRHREIAILLQYLSAPAIDDLYFVVDDLVERCHDLLPLWTRVPPDTVYAEFLRNILALDRYPFSLRQQVQIFSGWSPEKPSPLVSDDAAGVRGKSLPGFSARDPGAVQGSRSGRSRHRSGDSKREER